MMANPQRGERVRIHYRESCAHFPLQGKIGVVVIVGKGKPRNHVVEVEGTLYSVPCGNLQKIKS